MLHHTPLIGMQVAHMACDASRLAFFAKAGRAEVLCTTAPFTPHTSVLCGLKHATPRPTTVRSPVVLKTCTVMGKLKATLFDVTIPIHEETENYAVVGARLNCVATKFVFERLSCVWTRDSYRARLRTRKRLRLDTFISKYRAVLWGATCRAAPPSGRGKKGFTLPSGSGFRRAGPWTEKDIPISGRLTAFLGLGMRPWQTDIFEDMLLKRASKIVLVRDAHGASGKSSFIEYVTYQHMAVEIPFTANVGEFVASVNSAPASRAWVTTVPASTPRSELHAFCDWMGTLKNQHQQWSASSRGCAPKDYSHQLMVIFAADLPEFIKLQGRIWDIYNMVGDFSLQPMSECEALARRPGPHTSPSKRRKTLSEAAIA